MSAAPSYTFGNYTLDLGRGALLKGGVDVKLRPKSFGVLRLLIERHGQLVSKDDLLTAVWGRHAVVTDGVLTQCLIDVRRALGDESQSLIRTVPRRGYIFDVPVTVAQVSSQTTNLPAIPVASINEEQQPGSPAAAPAVVSAGNLEQIDVAWPLRAATIFFAIAAAVAGAAWWWGISQRADPGQSATTPSQVAQADVTRKDAAAPPPNSIAVLPFVNMSSEPEQEYFSDGISEEILNSLAQSPQLLVIARTSSFSFKGQPNASVADIAAKLNVAYVLEGSVRKSADRVRITAQLVNTTDSTHLWSETYDRDSWDTFAVQREIATHVTKALKVALATKQGAGDMPRNPLAYERFLQGQYFYNRRAPGDIDRAMKYYEEAVAIDPGWARAWAELSGAYGLQAWEGDRSVDWRSRQRDAAQRAVMLDPNLVAAQLRLARYYFEVSDHGSSHAHLRKAAALAPDDPSLKLLIEGLGPWEHYDFEAAVEDERRTVARDPLSAIARQNLGLFLFAANLPDEAMAEFHRAMELNPELGWDVQIEISRILIAQRRYDDAHAEIMRLPEGEARDSGLVLLYHAPGQRTEADAALGRLVASQGDHMHDVRLAEAYVLRDLRDEAFVWLQRARDGLEQDQSLSSRIWYLQNDMNLSPFLKPLHADPRWRALMADPG